MKKFLCLIAVFCMVLSVWSVPAAAQENLYDYFENIDVPFYYDLDGDGIEDTFSVDCYSNYFGRYAFNINNKNFIFDVVRHGSYAYFAVVDIDETDSFLDIVLIGSYKGAWGTVFRYDGEKLLAHPNTLEVTTRSDYEGLDELVISAGGDKLSIKCGEETFVHEGLNFEPAKLYTEQQLKEEDPDWYCSLYTVEVDGEVVEFDQCPVNKNDRLLVPVRAIFEKMGYAMIWDEETRTAHAASGDNFISVQIGNKTIFYTIDGVSGTYECDVAPQIVGDRTLIPLRGVAESGGCTVEWDEDANTARITTKK